MAEAAPSHAVPGEDAADLAALVAQPHRRYNPLIDEWVLVSTGRTQRPWQGRHDPRQADARPSYDPTCYLCPGNTRANGRTNPVYDRTFVFDNDFAALEPDSSAIRVEDDLLVAEGEPGTCRVICFSPRHDLTMARMSPEDVRATIDMWAEQSIELAGRYRWVQVFENRGETMGASNPHPHGQIWAGTALPREAAREDEGQRRRYAQTGRPLLLDYAVQEHAGPRVVVENDEWLVVVPFWAVWPFETLVIPKRRGDPAARPHRHPARRPGDHPDRPPQPLRQPLPPAVPVLDGLAPAPSIDGRVDHWQLHAHFYPPLLRSATVRKFLVGYELLAETQRDLSAEDAAARLRSVSPVHYLLEDDPASG